MRSASHLQPVRIAGWGGVEGGAWACGLPPAEGQRDGRGLLRRCPCCAPCGTWPWCRPAPPPRSPPLCTPFTATCAPRPPAPPLPPASPAPPASAPDLGAALRDERRHGVVAQVQPLGDARRDGQHVLQRAADLDARQVRGGVDAHGGAGKQRLYLARQLGVAGRRDEACRGRGRGVRVREGPSCRPGQGMVVYRVVAAHAPCKGPGLRAQPEPPALSQPADAAPAWPTHPSVGSP
jgi:hypothetical protein